MKYKLTGGVLLVVLLLLAVFASGSDGKRRSRALAIMRQAREFHLAGRHADAQNMLLKARFIWKEIPEPDWAAGSHQASSAQDYAVSMQKRHSDRVAAILLEARQAHTRWDTERARALIVRARLLEPRLSDPEWLKSPPGPRVAAEKPLDRQQLLAQLHARPDEARMLALENYLKEHPGDEEARKLLMQTAISVGAVNVLQRLPGAGGRQTDGQLLLVCLKWFGLLLILATLIWQTHSLWVDFKQH